MDNPNAENLGPPDIEFAGLQMWVHGRAYPESKSDYDYNHLDVTVHCGRDFASVWGTGSFFTQYLWNLKAWLDEIKELHRTLKGQALLEDLEPCFSVLLKATPLGHINMEVSIIIGIQQKHCFGFETDQTFLPPLIKQIEAVLEQYPIRDTRCILTRNPVVNWVANAFSASKDKTKE